MRQLFQNLIGNSLKFSQRGIAPLIRIRAAMAPKEIIVKRHLDLTRDYCLITFTDNGIGFPPEEAEKIFDIFQRLHGRDSYAGTGIGLALCRKIVYIHNGDIYAVSDPEAGTTFHVLLPYRQKPQPAETVK
jgi:signal transduction histidine kinase